MDPLEWFKGRLVTDREQLQRAAPQGKLIPTGLPLDEDVPFDCLRCVKQLKPVALAAGAARTRDELLVFLSAKIRAGVKEPAVRTPNPCGRALWPSHGVAVGFCEPLHPWRSVCP